MCAYAERVNGMFLVVCLYVCVSMFAYVWWMCVFSMYVNAFFSLSGCESIFK